MCVSCLRPAADNSSLVSGNLTSERFYFCKETISREREGSGAGQGEKAGKTVSTGLLPAPPSDFNWGITFS